MYCNVRRYVPCSTLGKTKQYFPNLKRAMNFYMYLLDEDLKCQNQVHVCFRKSCNIPCYYQVWNLLPTAHIWAMPMPVSRNKKSGIPLNSKYDLKNYTVIIVTISVIRSYFPVNIIFGFNSLSPVQPHITITRNDGLSSIFE